MKRFLPALAVLFLFLFGGTAFAESGTDRARFGAGSEAGEAKTLTVNGIGYRFRWCPPGEFMMGSPETEEGRNPDEVPHKVQIARGFWLLETEVTQEMWESVMGTTIEEQHDLARGVFFAGMGGQFPVYYVNWDDANRFCGRLSEESGETILLPAEEEWEYACRAGTGTALYSGDLKILELCNAPALDPISWYGGNSSIDYTGGGRDESYETRFWTARQYWGKDAGTHRVKGKKPNAWGLYDMIGNVWEWCSDRYDEEGASAGSRRVYRGGSWISPARHCRSAARGRNNPNHRSIYTGFRILLAPDGE